MAKGVAREGTLRAATEWLVGAALTWRDRQEGPYLSGETERWVESIEQKNLNDAALAYLAALEKLQAKKLLRVRRK